MLKKNGGGHYSHHHHGYWYDPQIYLFVGLPIMIINFYIYGLEYIKNEETKTRGIIMLTCATILLIAIILFIGYLLYSL